MSAQPAVLASLLAPIAMLGLVVGAAPAAASTGGIATAGAVSAYVRVDQLGFTPGETKIAYLISEHPVPDASFKVVDDQGNVALQGSVGHSRGKWNVRYGAVHPIDLTALHVPGTYRIRVHGPVAATSTPFRIASSAELFGPRITDIVAFFQAQRDGANVISGPLHRKPSHLNDRQLQLYDWPTYEDPDSDVIVGESLIPVDGTVDLAGGWFDAGDFIKFTHTTAYADALLFATIRQLGPQTPASLRAEARFGLKWLERAWHPGIGVLDLQVGIGSGNQDGTFNGDHDLWRLPERDDHLTGPENRYLRHRPAFRANEPGTALPPNLAGRVAAAFALAAQTDAASDPARARRELNLAADIFAAAKKTNVAESDVVTALPHAFYPESSWRDDLELASAELALAAQRLGDDRAPQWVRAGTKWAAAYLDREAGDDTLNLYDTSALAHADLIRALRQAGAVSGLALGEPRLVQDLSAQLERGSQMAAADPFRSGVTYNDFDAAPHTFGLVATAALYRAVTGDGSYDEFATEQRNWALGANAWGVSLMIGVGTRFPHCPQHVVANLSGRVDGTPPYLRGAVVNGPNAADLFSDGLGEFFDEGQTCPANGKDIYKQFTAKGSRFVDDVRSWQTVEPAIDFDAAAILAFGLLR